MTDITLTEIEAQRLLEVTEAAYNFLWVRDLADGYLKLNRQARSSPLTLALEGSVDLLKEKVFGEPVQDN